MHIASMLQNQGQSKATTVRNNLSKKWQHFPAPPSLLGISEFIVSTGSFFHAQTHVSFHIIEELSPNVRMIPPSVLNEEGVRRNILQWIVLGFDTFEEQIVGFCSVLAGRDAYGACHLQMICTKLAQKGIQVNLLPAFEFLPIDGFWVKLFIIEQLC